MDWAASMTLVHLPQEVSTTTSTKEAEAIIRRMEATVPMVVPTRSSLREAP